MNATNPDPPFDLLKMDRHSHSRVRLRRIAKVMVWGGVAVIGLKRGGVVGFMVAAYGLASAGRALTGEHSILKMVHRLQQHAGAPGAKPLDRVDEASRGSFPASDPPGMGF